jgi:hypothetical protein
VAPTSRTNFLAAEEGPVTTQADWKDAATSQGMSPSAEAPTGFGTASQRQVALWTSAEVMFLLELFPCPVPSCSLTARVSLTALPPGL